MGVLLEVGFNRYIVECKCAKKSHSKVDKDSFNRYIVECKYCP